MVQVNKYLHVEVEPDDLPPDWLLLWKLQMGSTKRWRYILGAIIYQQHVDGIPNMTADVFLWEGTVVSIEDLGRRRPRRLLLIPLLSITPRLRVTRRSWRSGGGEKGRCKYPTGNENVSKKKSQKNIKKDKEEGK